MKDRNWRTQSLFWSRNRVSRLKRRKFKAQGHPLVAKAPPIQPVHWPPPTTTHAFGMCDMLSPPRGGWSSCTLERVKSLPHSQLIDYSCLHKQIDLLPTQKSTLLLGRPDESERAPPKQPTGGGAESRCRAENKRVHISAGA